MLRGCIGALRAARELQILAHRKTLRHPFSQATVYQKSNMKLWAISDIHLSYRSNKDEFDKLKPRGEDDGLILAGDSTFQLTIYLPGSPLI